MSAAFAARASRQSVIFAGIVALHVGVIAIMAMGMKLPPLPPWIQNPIHVTVKPPPPMPPVRPKVPEPVRYDPGVEPLPPIDIPRDQQTPPAPEGIRRPTGEHAGEVPDVPVAVVRVAIGADGRVAALSVAQSTGFPRLDGAVDCVLRRLEFLAGRRDGRAAELEVLLPVVFRLN